jgi:hypothetical protein
MSYQDFNLATVRNSSFYGQGRGAPPWTPPLGRIDAEQAAKILGFEAHDIPVLVSHRLLKPLGNVALNARKYFALVDIMALAEDPVWLGKATQVVFEHWQRKNASRTKPETEAEAATATLAA